MTYPKDESGKWAQATTKAADEYVLNRDKILDNAAARGFGAVPGDAVFDLFELGQDTKGKLMEGLGRCAYRCHARHVVGQCPVEADVGGLAAGVVSIAQHAHRQLSLA